MATFTVTNAEDEASRADDPTGHSLSLAGGEDPAEHTGEVERVASEMLSYDPLRVAKRALTVEPDAPPTWVTKIDQMLIEAYQDQYGVNNDQNKDIALAPARNRDGLVVVDALALPYAGEALLDGLEALGLQKGAVYGRVVSGLLPIEAIPAALSEDALSSIRESVARANVGSVQALSDPASWADVVRSTFRVDGSGVKIGILSDSFNNTPADAA